MVSTNSKYDKFLRNEAVLSTEENAGLSSFNSLNGGDCFHCHGGILGTDLSFKNNGLDEIPVDSGRGLVTGRIEDNFKCNFLVGYDDNDEPKVCSTFCASA